MTVCSANADLRELLHPCVFSTLLVTVLACKLKTCMVPGNGVAQLRFRGACGGGGGIRGTHGVRVRIRPGIVTCVRQFRDDGGANCHFSLSDFRNGSVGSRFATHALICVKSRRGPRH